jgi:hypothetical protein
VAALAIVVAALFAYNPISQWWTLRGEHAWYVRVDRVVSDGGSNDGAEVDMLYSRQGYPDEASCKAAASAAWPANVPNDPDTDVQIRGLFCSPERVSDAGSDGLYLEYVRDNR